MAMIENEDTPRHIRLDVSIGDLSIAGAIRGFASDERRSEVVVLSVDNFVALCRCAADLRHTLSVRSPSVEEK